MTEFELKRSQIVTNGCTGGCCAAFHLPYTPPEFDTMRKVYNEFKQKCQQVESDLEAKVPGIENKVKDVLGTPLIWIDRNGEERKVPFVPDIEYILDMLVFIEITNFSYENGAELTDEYRKHNNGEEPKEGVYNNMIYRNGKLHGIYYTCKHYDRALKICTDYENRPFMCRKHGAQTQCHYTGCAMKCENKVETKKEQ